MSALRRLETRSLPFKPPLEFRAGHRVNICVHLISGQAPRDVGSGSLAATIHASADFERVLPPPRTFGERVCSLNSWLSRKDRGIATMACYLGAMRPSIQAEPRESVLSLF